MQQLTKLPPRLTLGQQALLTTPKVQAVARAAMRWTEIHVPWLDRDERRALIDEALVLRVRSYDPAKGSFENHASAFVRGHVLRAGLKERAALPRIAPMLRVLERGRHEHRASKERMEEASASREHVRRRTIQRLSRMTVEIMTEAARVEHRTPETLLIAQQERARLDRALREAQAQLPDELAEVMRLRQEGRTVADVAAALGCSPRTASRRLAEALVRFEHALRAAGVKLPDDD